MDAHVIRQGTGMRECLLTGDAAVRLFPSVKAHVIRQGTGPREGLAACSTVIGF